MRCPYCDSELPDSSRFCPNCGAEQSPQSSSYTPPSSSSYTQSTSRPAGSQQSASAQPPRQSAPQKKKGNWLVRILVAVVVYFLARGAGYLVGSGMAKSGSSSAKQTTAPKATQSSISLATVQPDAIVLQKVYFESESDGAATFEAIRYGNDTNAIKELVYIYQCDKSYGYTREGLESVAFKDQFPLISAFSIYDDGDLWTVVVHTKNVDTSMVLQMLQDKGLIIPEEGSTLTNGIRADYYIQSILDQGGREATASEIAALHLP